MAGFLGGAEDQFPPTQPPAAAAEFDEFVAGEAGVDFFSSGDWTWNLFPAEGDVGFKSGDFTWNGDPTVTEAIKLFTETNQEKSGLTVASWLPSLIGRTDSTQPTDAIGIRSPICVS